MGIMMGEGGINEKRRLCSRGGGRVKGKFVRSA